MPFINQYRYIEFIYGQDKNRIMTSEPFSPMGESMQVEATNTAGKSMSIITILQAVVPLVDTNKTALDVFNNQHPLYMLIEWITEDNTKVLTGIGLVRKQKNFSDQDKRHDKTKLFDLVTFIVEYDKENAFDINNIELQYEKENRLYCKNIDETLKMFEDIPSAKSIGVKYIKLYRKSYLKDYKDKLKEYGIYPEEWEEVIARLNKGESVLSEYFDKNKTTESLMKNVLLPTVEENITTSKNNDFIKEIQENLIRYREYIVEHKNELNEYENLKALREKILELDKNIDETILCEQEEQLVRVELCKLYNNVDDSIKKLESNITLEEESTKRLNNRMDNIEYNEESFKYSKEQEEIFNATDVIKAHDANIITISKALEENVQNLNLYELQQVLKELSENEKELSFQRTEQEKLTKSESELNEKINNVGYNLRLHYLEEVESRKDYERINEENIKNTRMELAALEATLADTEEKKEKTSDEIAALVSWLNSYEEEEIELTKEVPGASDYIETILGGKRFNLNILVDKLSKDNAKNEDEHTNLKKLITEKTIEINNMNESIMQHAFDIQVKQKNLGSLRCEYETFKRDKAAIITSFEKFDLNEALLYKKDEAYGYIEKLLTDREEKKTKQLERSKELLKEISFLQGDTKHLIPDKVIEEFISLGIDVLNGLDWLNKQQISFEKKKAIYENNPLLIYSLVVTEKEYEKLKNIKLRINNLSPLPLILRHQLPEDTMEVNSEVKLLNNIYHNKNQRFMVFFDSNMLDEDILADRIKELEEYLKKCTGVINTISSDIDNLYSFKNKLDAFNYEVTFESTIATKIEALDLEIKDLIKMRSNLQSKLPLLEKELLSINDKITEVNKLVDIIKDQIKAVSAFSDRYCNYYSEKYSRKVELTEEKTRLDLEIKKLKLKKDTLLDGKEKLAINSEKIKNELKNFNKELDKYLSYEIGNILDETVDSLIGKYESLKKNSKAEDIAKINESIGLIKKKISDLEKEKERLAVLVGENILFNYDLDKVKLDKERSTLVEQLSDEKIAKSGVEGQLREKNKNLESLYKSIFDKFHKEPLASLEIVVLDYESEKNKIKALVDSSDKRIKNFRISISNLKSFFDKLDEYKELTEGSFDDLGVEDVKTTFDSLKNSLTISQKRLQDSQQSLGIKHQELFTLLSSDKQQIYDLLLKTTELIRKKELCYNIKLSTEAELDRLKVRKQEIENERQYIYNSIKNYVDDVIKGLRRLSDIAKSNGERLMKITLKDENIDYREIFNIIDNAADSTSNITSAITTFYLLDIIAKIRRIKVDIVQYELYSKRMVNWDELGAMTTGAQKFCISFILLIVLMEYKRYDEKYLDRQSLGKVLLMDNPFGEISEGTLLKPVFDLAKKLKVQIISYTHIQNQAIRDCFNKIYLLTVRKLTSGREFTELTKIKDTIDESAETSKFFVETTFFDSL